MKKLLIADADEEFRAALQEAMQDSYHVEACREGGEALRLLESFRPDAMILDLLLPGLDGVTLLQKAESAGIKATTLVATRFVSDYMMDAMERLNVGYVMMKPCEVSAVKERLADLMCEKKPVSVQELSQQELQRCVDGTLHRLGCPAHLRGYACLREVLMKEIRDPGQQVTKILYPEVGKLCGGNGEQVEHAIRCLIRRAWLYRQEEVWNELFPTKQGTQPKCPSNKAFIAAVAGAILTNSRGKDTYLRGIG